MDVKRIHRHITSSIGEASADPTREAIRRLRVICLALMFVPGVMMIVMMALAPVGAPQHDSPRVMATLIITAMAASGLVRYIAGIESIAPERRLAIGFAYQIVLAFVIAFARHWMPWQPGDGYREVSPVAILILAFAALLPNPHRRTFVISLVSASMDPLALYINVMRGNPMPPLVQATAICFGTFMATIVATIISHVVYGLSSTVQRERAMGSYTLVEKLGEGGMGEVWRAEHRLLARPAAIKLIRQDAGIDGVAIKRFEREAQATAALRSPHTVQLYDFGVSDDGTFYYVMELLDGLDLEALVERHGPLAPERVVHVLVEACDSLEEAHESGLVHRDIKPANIYVCKLGREFDFVKVLDFGLVKPKAREADGTSPTVTMKGTFAGTPAFLAPEMVLAEKEIDGRADIYALGCVAYWLLTGKYVFDTTNLLKMVSEHVHVRPKPPSERIDRPIPQDLEKIVLQCLEKDPADRPQSCGQLRARLQKLVFDAPWSRERASEWWKAHPKSREIVHPMAPTVPSIPE